MGSVTGGGEDQTNEELQRIPGARWPIMGGAKYISNRRTAFSIEEMTTLDEISIPPERETVNS
jgi:hypothetical protein